MFWPTTLASAWYRETITSLAHSNIHGMGRWFSEKIENLHERIAYVNTISRCRDATAKAYSLDNALETLLMIKFDIEKEPRLGFFSLERLRGDTHRHQMLAVDQCIELVRALREKYLFT